MKTTRQLGAAGADGIAGASTLSLQRRLGLDVVTRPAPALDQGSNAVLLERIQTLRTILPAMATEVAIARREGARLRRENATLRGRLATIEGPRSATDASAQSGRVSR